MSEKIEDNLENALNSELSDKTPIVAKKETIETSYNNPNFSTRDITLVATLKTLGHEVLFVEFQFENGRDVGYFSFENSQKLDKNLQDFYNNKILVEPKSFMGELKSAKSRVTSFFKKSNSIE